MTPLYGGIEGGGTKFVCAIGTGPQDIRAEIRIPTTTPRETLGRVIEFFKNTHLSQGEEPGVKAIGAACFGPLDPNPTSPTFGHILPTPKPGWTNANIVGTLQAELGVPVAFDTDVNGAVLAEALWGAGKDCDPVLYLTVGTGIGGGALINGKLLHGLLHPEMGHLPLPHDPAHDPFPGICPFHGDCFEGLASGPAMEKRWGQSAETLSVEHAAWDMEAHYLALALSSYILTLAPQKIIIGGGVGSVPRLLALTRQKVQHWLNNYFQSAHITQNIEAYIVPPALGHRAGILGAIALAQTGVHP